jgi:hypothetical protein
MKRTWEVQKLGTKENNIIDVNDPDKPIYRVFTLDRLFDTIISKKLALVRPRLWQDPFENLLYQIPLRDKDGEAVSVDGLRNRLYGQCWTRASVSDALWRIYSPHQTGVRARSTTRKLLQALWDAEDSAAHLKYFIGQVRYEAQGFLLKKFRDPQAVSAILDSTGRAPVASLLLKRKAFRHEQEVRLIFHSGKDMQQDVVFFPIDPNAVFDSLLFDPRMDPTTVSTFEGILRQNGFMKRISQSTLYAAPKLQSQTL